MPKIENRVFIFLHNKIPKAVITLKKQRENHKNCSIYDRKSLLKVTCSINQTNKEKEKHKLPQIENIYNRFVLR
jgi:hypothetical protein